MKITRVKSCGLRLQLIAPPPDLAPYITCYYRNEAAPGPPIEDWLPPEWANLRVGTGEVYEAAIGPSPLRRPPIALLSGPTSRVTRLLLAGGDFWGVGLLPLGWAKFIGVPASEFADQFRDIAGHPAVAPLQAVIDHLYAAPADMGRNVALLNAAFRALLAKPLPQHAAIVRTHEAILSDRFTTVAALADHLGTSTRTLERFVLRHFGFAPKLLLRRQRFLRSLAKFMVDPSMTWLESLDNHYHDQAQFIREFKYFMLMRPREYAAMNHPIAMTAVRARRMALGDPMQVLHAPLRAPTAIEPVERPNTSSYETL